MHSGFEIVECLPSVEAYQKMRRAVGWAEVDEEAVQRGLAQSLYSVCVLRDGETVGHGRVVGDGGVYFYIQDVMLLPEYQGQGLGSRIMAAIMAYLDRHAKHNSFVGLMAAEGVASFYHKYGFTERFPDRPGMFRMWP